jgi:hypothetical protein
MVLANRALAKGPTKRVTTGSLERDQEGRRKLDSKMVEKRVSGDPDKIQGDAVDD